MDIVKIYVNTVGIIATFINYAQNFVSPLRQLANMYNAIQAAFVGKASGRGLVPEAQRDRNVSPEYVER